MSSSRKNSQKGKGKAPNPPIPNPIDEANQQWMNSLMSMGSPPGQNPYAGPSPLQTPPVSRFSPFFQSTLHSPADDVYRPQIVQSLFDTPGSTPGDDGSQAPTDLSTDDYEVEETPVEPPSRSRKGKAPVPMSSTATDTASGEKPKRTRTTYTLQESELIAQCWGDTTHDAENSNYQTELVFWARVTEKYREHKTPSMKDHGSEAIRRHWERLMKDCGHFNGIYSNLMTNMRSGENEQMVRDEAIKKYCAQFVTKGFKYWSIYEKLKELPKFRTAMHVALHGKAVRRRLSGAESEGSASPIDLTGDGPHERPAGSKKVKGRRAGKSALSDAQSDSQFIQQATFSSNVANLTQLYTLYFTGGGTPEEKQSLWSTIQNMKIQMGLPPDAPTS